MIKLSKHFSLAELIRSQTAARHDINNNPPDSVIINLERTAAVLERIRVALGNRRIFVTSGYRSPQLNSKIGGSRTSAHMDGRAADIEVEGMTPLEAARAIHASDVVLDQLILEFGEWVHVGIPRVGDRPRGDVMTAMFDSGRVIYKNGISGGSHE